MSLLPVLLPRTVGRVVSSLITGVARDVELFLRLPIVVALILPGLILPVLFLLVPVLPVASIVPVLPISSRIRLRVL
jgi:hypothetical protein